MLYGSLGLRNKNHSCRPTRCGPRAPDKASLPADVMMLCVLRRPNFLARLGCPWEMRHRSKTQIVVQRFLTPAPGPCSLDGSSDRHAIRLEAGQIQDHILCSKVVVTARCRFSSANAWPVNMQLRCGGRRDPDGLVAIPSSGLRPPRCGRTSSQPCIRDRSQEAQTRQAQQPAALPGGSPGDAQL